MKAAALLCAGALAGALCATPPAAAWSPPARLNGCDTALAAAADQPPLIVYPGSSPAARSGPGLLLWNGPAGCGGLAAGADGSVDAAVADGVEGAADANSATGASREPSAPATAAFGARLGATGLPGPGRTLGRGTDGLTALSAATGTTAGQVLAVGAQAADGEGAFVEGRLPGSFSTPHPLGGPAQPVAAFSGYLGDAVIASLARAPHGRWALALGVQRHYASRVKRFAPLVLDARPTALAVTADYRAEVLAVWAGSGQLYACQISNTGKAGAVRRVASAPPGAGGAAWRPEVRALFSDDGRAIVAWRSQAPGAAAGIATTTIDASISSLGPSFGPPALVERYRDPRGLQPPPGSLRLTRMSSEAVMLAWTGLRAGRYVVRASPVSLRRGVWAPVTVSPRGPREALLAELVPGPRAEVLALWSAAPRLSDGALDGGRRAILAAWGHYAGHGEAVFASPETLAPPGPNGTPAAAFDPANDRALAAWVQSSRSPQIVYAQRAAGPPALATPARASPGSGAGRAPPAAQSATARAGTARAGPPEASARASAASYGARSRGASSHGAGGRGALLTALGLALLLVAAVAAYRGIGRRRGWIGAGRVP